MIERLNEIEKKYEDLGTELTKPETLQDVELLTKLAKEQRKLEKTVVTYRKYKQVVENIKADAELLKDEDLKDIAREELQILEPQKVELEQKLEALLLPKDENDDKNIIMELRGAAGGDEANIFAGDLFRMYQKYAEKQGWKVDIINAEESSSGGFSQIECMIKGDNVYSKLKYESGAHRVQRIPTTESGGRIHTSTATVIVMPERDDVEIEVKPEDIKVDVYRSGGAGGQSVNTANSAVRITHIPSKIVVTCQTERSQLLNKEKAMHLLKNKLYQIELEKNQNKINEVKDNSSINFGSQIRSYVLEPYKLVKDHRTNYESTQPEKVFNGEIEDFIESNLYK